MAKYMFQGSYTDQGLRGVLKEGGSKRREAIASMTEKAGGKLEAFYFSLGSDDFTVIADFPSNVDVAAVGLVANASGAARVRTTVLLTPEEIDQAAKKAPAYRPPGS